VNEVLALAQTYTDAATASDQVATTAGALAVSWALSQIGTPYVWGGETPGVAFDCSGPVKAAYAVAGVALPQVAQAGSWSPVGPG
jgi:cell wall-associated NlpC family hydrolase